VVIGNPRPGSRTLTAATTVARGLTGSEPDLVVDLATVGAGLLDPQDAAVGALVDKIGAADLVVVASPTYKATYTGLLKLFLDRFAGGAGLRGVAVPLMLGATPRHALAAELHLRPLLVELGAAVPTPALFVLDHEHDRPEAYDAWLSRARPVVTALERATGAPA
jgi:FMN reductase